MVDVPGEPFFEKGTVYRILVVPIIPFEGQPRVLKLLSAECIALVHPDFVDAVVQHAFQV